MEKEQSSILVRWLSVCGVLLNFAIARFAPGAAVRRLVAALGSPNEDTSVAAYMALVKLGPRNATRLLDEARHGRQTANVLLLLGDLGDQSIIPALKEFANSSDTQVATAALESIDVLLSDKPQSPESGQK